MIGRKLVEKLPKNYNVSIANRNISHPNLFKDLNLILIDRNNLDSCRVLQSESYDVVIDLSCYELNQFQNTFNYLSFKEYIFISSSAVEGLSFENESRNQALEMFNYAFNKKECEDFIKSNIKNYTIFRPCYVVGDYDYTNRFYKKDNQYYFNDGTKLYYCIENENLADLIIDSIGKSNNLTINPCRAIYEAHYNAKK